MDLLSTKRKLLPLSGYLDMGGGSGSSTSGGTSVQELPEWARGYAKDTLSKASALTDINQNPYQTYGQARIAGFSPMQQTAMQSAANIQTGPEAFQKGVTGYMNPYIEQSLKPQIAEANRGYDISGQRQQGQATQAGAFGGSRDAIMRAENERNRNMGIQNIVGQGYNTAYNNAQNQYNTGFNQNMLVNQLQSQYGAQQQAQAQKGLDVGYQDFLNQQNYPYKQLGFMSDLVRGMPLGQATTRSMYEPAPGLGQQIGSVGLGAYGLSKLGGMAEGGVTEAYKLGGSIPGGSVMDRDNVASIIHDIPEDADLQKAMQAAQARGDQDQIEAIQTEMGLRASLRRGIAGGVTNEMADRMAGGGVVAFAGGGSSDTLAKLGKLGETDLTETPEQQNAGISAAMPGVEQRYGPSVTAPYLEQIKGERAGLSKMNDEGIGLGALAASQALLRPGSASRAISGALGAFGTEVTKMKKEQREADRLLRQSEISLATAEQARKDGLTGKAEAMYDKSQAQKEKGLDRKIGVLEKQATIQAGIENSKRQAEATMAGVNKPTFDMSMVKAKIAEELKAHPEIANDPKAMAALESRAYSDTAREVKSAYPSTLRADQGQVATRLKVENSVDSQLLMPGPLKTQFKLLQEQDKKNGTNTAMQFRDGLIEKSMGTQPAPQGGGQQTPTPQKGQPMYATNGKERIVSTDGGQTWKPAGAQ